MQAGETWTVDHCQRRRARQQHVCAARERYEIVHLSPLLALSSKGSPSRHFSSSLFSGTESTVCCSEDLNALSRRTTARSVVSSGWQDNTSQAMLHTLNRQSLNTVPNLKVSMRSAWLGCRSVLPTLCSHPQSNRHASNARKMARTSSMRMVRAGFHVGCFAQTTRRSFDVQASLGMWSASKMNVRRSAYCARSSELNDSTATASLQVEH
jgi:hypothetical protein